MRWLRLWPEFAPIASAMPWRQGRRGVAGPSVGEVLDEAGGLGAPPAACLNFFFLRKCPSVSLARRAREQLQHRGLQI